VTSRVYRVGDPVYFPLCRYHSCSDTPHNFSTFARFSCLGLRERRHAVATLVVAVLLVPAVPPLLEDNVFVLNGTMYRYRRDVYIEYKYYVTLPEIILCAHGERGVEEF